MTMSYIWNPNILLQNELVVCGNLAPRFLLEGTRVRMVPFHNGTWLKR